MKAQKSRFFNELTIGWKLNYRMEVSDGCMKSIWKSYKKMPKTGAFFYMILIQFWERKTNLSFIVLKPGRFKLFRYRPIRSPTFQQSDDSKY
jgi:hypothetical protein